MGTGGGTGSEKTVENVRFGGFGALGHTWARAVFWENFAGAVLVAFGGRFWGPFGVVFGCFLELFSEAHMGLRVFFAGDLERFFAQSLSVLDFVSFCE